MQVLRRTGPQWPQPRAEFSALLLTCDGLLGPTARCLVQERADIELAGDLFFLLSCLADDPRSADLVVIDCDGFGGLDAVLRGLGRLGPDEARAPVILIAQNCREQIFPQSRHEPTLLRAPLSPLALRLALELRLGRPGMILA